MNDQKITYQQQAYEYVKSKILTIGYKPGEMISDSQIARELDVSRTPVREAFCRLENEGLLINDGRRGWRIFSLSLEDIHEIFDLKVVVEGMLARKAARCQDQKLRQTLQEALSRMQDANQAVDADGWLQADFALHDILFKMAGNERAIRVVENLNDQWHRVRIGFAAMRGRMQNSTREHEDLVAAILSSDPDAAEAEMQSHLNAVREELVRLLVDMVFPYVEEGV